MDLFNKKILWHIIMKTVMNKKLRLLGYIFKYFGDWTLTRHQMMLYLLMEDNVLNGIDEIMDCQNE